MKKLISLLISISTVIGSLSLPVHAAEQADKESWIAMKSFGVLAEEATEESTFTIAEMAGMLYRLYHPGDEVVPEGTRQIYTDVDRWYWAAGYIEWLYYNQVFTGDGSGTLEPEKKATLSDVCTVMVNLLGYQKIGEILQTTQNPVQKAGELGILPASVSRKEHEVTYEEFAAICYEVLFTDVMEVSFEDNLGFCEGREFIESVLGMEYAEGVVTGASGFSLTYQECGADEIVIDGNSLQLSEGMDCSDLLGYHVQYFYDEDTDIVMTVIPMENQVLTISSDKLLEYEDNRYRYEEEERERTAKVDVGVMLLYNGKITTNPDAFMPEYGQITLIDNDDDGVYECIISESVINVVLSSVVSGVLLGKNSAEAGRKYSLDLEELDRYDIVGTTEPIEKWKENTIVSVALSEDGLYAKLFVSTESVTGKLQGLTAEEIWVNDKEYMPAVGLFNPNMINTAGNDIAIYLDIFGNVAAILGNYEGKYQLGYLMDIRDDDVEDKLILKILTSDSQVKKIYTAEKLYINGDKIESTEGAKESLVVNELIKYRMSGEEIKYIDTAIRKKGFESYQSASDKDSLRMIADGTMIYKATSQLFKKYSTMSLHGEFALNDKTQVFFIPADETNADDDDYYVGTRTGLPDDFNGTIQGYVTGAFTLTADAVVVRHRTTIKHGTAITVVESVVPTVDENDDVVYKINGMRSGKDVEIIVRDADLLKTNNGTVDKGSVIRYQTDKNGVVKTIEHMYNPENKEGVLTNASHTYTHTSTGVNAHVRIMLGTIQSHSGTIAQFRFLDEVSSDKDEVFNLKNCNVYVYDASEKDSVRAGTIDEVRDFSYYGSLGDEVIIVTRAVTTSDVIIMKR